MDNTTKVFKWQNYELICSARPADLGRFIPSLVVSKQIWPTRPREIAVARGQYMSSEEAIEAAYNEGLEWIKNYG